MSGQKKVKIPDFYQISDVLFFKMINYMCIQIIHELVGLGFFDQKKKTDSVKKKLLLG